MPTRPSSSTARSSACFLLTDLSCARIISVICQPTLYSGCRLVSGSWKMTEICAPRIRLSWSGRRLSRSVPSKTAFPSTHPPGISPSRVCVSTVLPLPDSPTMPSVRPFSTLNDTPRTACTRPSAVGKLTRRSVTSSRLTGPSDVAACGSPPRASPGRAAPGAVPVTWHYSTQTVPVIPFSESGRACAAHARPDRVASPVSRPCSAAGYPHVGDVGAVVGPVDHRRRAQVLNPLAGVVRKQLVQQRDEDRVLHHVHVRLVPDRASRRQRGRRLRLLDQVVQRLAAVAAVVAGVDHAVGLEQRRDHGTAVVAEPVRDPARLAQVPRARLVVLRRVAEVDEEARARLALALQGDAVVDGLPHAQLLHHAAVVRAAQVEHDVREGAAPWPDLELGVLRGYEALN